MAGQFVVQLENKPGLVEMIFCVDDETKAHAGPHGTEGENVGVAD